MIVLCYGWFFFLIVSTLSLIVAIVVEKNFDECHPVKKWWRRNIIDNDPEDAKYKSLQDDIQE